MLRGEQLDALSRELGVTAATLTGWRDQLLAGGQAAVRSRPADGRDDELAQLKAKVGKLTMENGLLRTAQSEELRARVTKASSPT